MMHMPELQTARLLIRPFIDDDLDDIHQLLDRELEDVDFGTEGTMRREDRRRWLQWSVLNVGALAQLNQPPYGDRAIVRRDTHRLIGACGFVPCLAPFAQLPSLRAGHADERLYSTEFGLFYALSPAQRRQGYATEAMRAMVAYAFDRLRLARIVATTTHDNLDSIAVMRRLGMRIDTNPYAEPPWLQVVGILDNQPG